MMNDWFLGILACPNCGDVLPLAGSVLVCAGCGFSTPHSTNIDLRPTQNWVSCLELQRKFDAEEALAGVEFSRPTVTYVGPTGLRDSTELLSLMQQSLSRPSRVLDLGSGPKDQCEPIRFLGHDYVGADISSASADILADAHALPFQNASFDFVFSFAVLEHLHNPFIALKEIKRVLKIGGYYCGTVSQGEPFHNSFFHHTTWGMLSLAHALNLEVLRLWPCWDTLSGLADMGRYPKVLRSGMRLLDLIHRKFPVLAPRKMLWPQQDRFLDELHRAASIGFLIRRNN